MPSFRSTSTQAVAVAVASVDLPRTKSSVPAGLVGWPLLLPLFHQTVWTDKIPALVAFATLTRARKRTCATWPLATVADVGASVSPIMIAEMRLPDAVGIPTTAPTAIAAPVSFVQRQSVPSWKDCRNSASRTVPIAAIDILRALCRAT